MPNLKNLQKFNTNDFFTRLGRERCTECMEIKSHCFQHRVDLKWVLRSDCRLEYGKELSEKNKMPYGPKSGGQVQSNRREF